MTEELATTTSANNWIGSRRQEPTYTFDDIISAFEAGKIKGKSEASKKMAEKVKTIISELWDVSTRLDEFLKVNDLNYKNIYLNIETEDYYKILIPIVETDLLKDEFMAIYDLSWGLEESLKMKHENINVQFHFSSYDSDKFDEESVICDGYQFKFRDM